MDVAALRTQLINEISIAGNGLGFLPRTEVSAGIVTYRVPAWPALQTLLFWGSPEQRMARILFQREREVVF